MDHLAGQAGPVDVVIWVTATSRASVLSGYGEAAVALDLLSPEGDSRGDADAVAARLIGWLQETARPWLVVLDDLAEAAMPDRLWPALHEVLRTWESRSRPA